MPVIICSSGNLKDYLPAGLTCIDISSLSNRTDITGKYVQAKIQTKYSLNTYATCSIKLVLENAEKLINLHAFGPIAKDLNSCSIRDTLVLTDFEVDVCPKDKRSNGRYQIILDDQKPVKSVVWVIKAPQTVRSSTSSPAKATSTGSPVRGSASNPQSPRPPKDISYTYTLLKDVTTGKIAHIYGVVSYVKAAMKTSGSDYYLLISIVDPSLSNVEERLSCNLFNNEKEKLPTQAVVGDVIRIHRLKGKIQGRSGPGCHWVLFQGSYETRVASSDNYTLQASDKDKVCELLTWWEDTSLVNQGSNQLDASGSPGPSRTGISTASPPTPSTPSILDQLTPMKAPVFTYKTLADVNQASEHATVNLYAVVIFCRPVVRTVRSEYHLMLNITDPTLDNKDAKLTCNLFDADRGKLPCQAVQGDIIRIHDLKITIFRGKRQGVKGQNFHWVLFQESFNTRLASCPDYLVEETERAKVHSLLDWWQEGPESLSFGKVVTKQYFTLVCQVILNLNVDDDSVRLLKVWDGTKFNGPAVMHSVAGQEDDPMFAKVAVDLDLVHDVFLYDNHIPSAQNIKPGDFIKLTNLHAAVVNGQVEMTLHGGTAYQRGVKKMMLSDRAVIKLKAVLDPLIAKHTAELPKKDDGSSGASTSHCASTTQSSKEDDGNNSRTDRDSTQQSPTEKNTALDNNISSTRKQLFHDVEPPSKKRSKGCQSSDTPAVDVIVVSDSSTAPSSLDVNNSGGLPDTELGARKTISTSDHNSVAITFDSPLFGSINRNTTSSSEFDQLTLSSSSISAPPSSLELTEKDRHMVEALLTREKKKVGKGIAQDATVIECGGNDSTVVTNADILSGISVSSIEGIQLSMYGSPPNQSSLSRDTQFSTNMCENLSKDKNSTAVSIVKTQTARLEGEDCANGEMNSPKRLQADIENNTVKNTKEKIDENDLNEIASSQESFHTAKDLSSPVARSVILAPTTPQSSSSVGFVLGKRGESRTGRVETRASKKRQKLSKEDFGSRSGSDEEPKSNSPSQRKNRHWRKLDSGFGSKLNKEKSKTQEEEDREMDEITSSQDSYHTASNLASPIMPRLSPQQSPAVSPRKVLSLRSQTNRNELARVDDNASSLNVNSQTSQNRKEKPVLSSSVLKESEDNTVSSSADSHYSIPNDRQPNEFDEEGISSSTDTKDSSPREEKEDPVSGGRRETTVTASIKNQTRQFSKLRTFIECKRPTKLKALVRLCRYLPCTGHMSDFVQLCCFQCKHVVSSSEIRSKRAAKCPNRCGELQAHIFIQLCLSDGEHEIKAELWGQNAVEFFQGVTAQELLHKASAKETFRKCLETVCPPDTDLEDKPLLECCLFSYLVENKLVFQIFDTVIL